MLCFEVQERLVVIKFKKDAMLQRLHTQDCINLINQLQNSPAENMTCQPPDLKAKHASRSHKIPRQCKGSASSALAFTGMSMFMFKLANCKHT